MLVRRSFLLGSAALGALALTDATAGRADAAPIDLGSAPPVALLATRAGTTGLHLVAPGGALEKPLVSFSHRDDGDVRAAMLPSGVVLAAAPWRAGRDRSFDGALFRLDAGAELLCEELVHASKPLVQDGRVFLARGVAGPVSDPARMRIDDLRIDRIDPQTGAAQTLHEYSGYMLHLAGALDDEIFVYRVGPRRADIVALDATTGALRVVLTSLPPFARDFSVDRAGRRLVYRGRHERDDRTWVVDAIEIDSGRRSRLYQGPEFALAPHAWPGGGVALSPNQGGLSLLGSRDRLRAPLGPGVDWIRAVSADGRFVAALHTRPGQLGIPFVIARSSGKSARLPAPPGARVAIAGFFEGTGA